MGERAKILFLIFAYLTLILVIAAFASIVADTFEGFNTDGSLNDINGSTATISLLFIVAALILGYLMNRFKLSSLMSSIIAVALLLVCVALGILYPIHLSSDMWIWIIALYIIIASIVPVWILLQPRDFLCSFLLYGLIGAAIIGILISNPNLSLPGFVGFETSIGYLFPALFITVACGAISGFHSLVASGTTSKQIKNEKDVLPIAFGGMLIECIVAVIALISVAYLYNGSMPSGTPTQIFAGGISGMLASIGLQDYELIAYSLVILAVSAFALTSLDTATRLARFIFQEMFVRKEESVKDITGVRKVLVNPVVATLLTVCLGMALAMVGYNNIWGLFGAANQLLAVLALLAISTWLANIGKSNRMIIIPMMFMFIATLTSLVLTIIQKGQILDSGFQIAAFAQMHIAIVLLPLAIFLMLEGIITLRKHKSE